MDTVKSIVEKCKAGYAAIYLTSPEEVRAIDDVKNAAMDLQRDLYVWGHGKGLVHKVEWRRRGINDEPELREGADPTKVVADTELAPMALAQMEKTDKPAIFVLRLFHHFMDDPLVQTQILDLLPLFRKSRRVLVVLSPFTKIPLELEKEFTLLETAFPTREELQLVLDGVLKGVPVEQHPTHVRRPFLVDAARGLTTTEAGNAFSLSIIRPRLIGGEDWDPNIVLAEKCQALKKTGIIEYVPISANGLRSIGGLDLLKAFVRRRQLAFTDEARAYGIPYPKGLLVIGPSGTGKSLGAKAISTEMQLPLLRLEMGKVYGGLVGQSEANIHRVLKAAEAMSPCVLWIDEIEKGMATGSGATDSGVGQRVLGMVLTWMQEKTSPVYVYATANRPNLPPELMRKGRFDEMFYVDLPSLPARGEIFSIHLEKLGRLDPIAPHIASLAATSDGYNGAEIEESIYDAMLTSFAERRELRFEDIVDSLHSTQPQSKIMYEDLKRIREWCSSRTRPASSPYREEQPTSIHSRHLEA